MKRYLVIDTLSDYKTITNEKGLKELLVEEINRDIESSFEEKDIVKENIKLLTKMANEDYSLEILKAELGNYSMKVIDMLQFQYDYNDILDYLKGSYYVEDYRTLGGLIKEVIDL